MPPPKKVQCANCEAEELRECGGDDLYYRCSGASEAEIDSRSGCGALISFKEYKAMKEATGGGGGVSDTKKASKPAAPPARSVAPHPLTHSRGGLGRRPLAPLHSNAINAKTSGITKTQTTHEYTQQAETNQTTTTTTSNNPPMKPRSAPPQTATKQPTKAGDSGKSSDDDDDDDDSDSSPGSASKSTKHAVSSSTTSSAPFNLSDRGVSAADRMRALRAKLAKQREKSLLEFREKYGEDGDEETEEDRAAAQRKQSGEAGEVFLSQGEVERAPMVASLSIKGAENPLAGAFHRSFIVPRAHGAMTSQAKSLIAERQKSMHVGRRLGARLRIFNGSFGAFKALESPPEDEVDVVCAPPPPPVVLTKAEELKAQPDGFQPLIVWQPTPEELKENPNLTPIEVPMIVCKWLRPHQREGVKFMCECVLGQRNLDTDMAQPTSKTVTNADGTTSTVTVPPPFSSLGGGAILADDMGLGKTLQSVALLYTLLSGGFEVGTPAARKVIVVTPTSLVSNWQNEIDKWLGKGTVNTIGLSEAGKEKIECGIDSYVGRGSRTHVLVISYDTFRRNVDRLNKPGLCDLLICDEAHRLKNNKTSTYTALDSLPTKRRILLSGTPMQNDLSEFFSMINFTNRNIIGDRKAFRKYYEMPILLGREPDCLESDAAEGSERASELSAIVNQFVLRRTNVLLRQHLPPKVIQIVCCRPSELQVKLYQHFLSSKAVKKFAGGDSDDGGGRASGGLQALPLITSLKKLCNHPKLIWDTAQNVNAPGGGKKGVYNEETGLTEKIPAALLGLFKGLAPLFHSYDGGSFIRNPSDPRYSGKMFVLERLLSQIRLSNSGERIVIVSNFTSALDVIAQMCVAKKWDHLRLDGSTSIKKRQQLVDQLSDHRGNKVFVFLLSSRAGGCGLNLVGANRLILFDPDWNPAVDKQAAARVWRDGQTKRCFVYRFLTTGSIEEKVYQRQLSKEGLSGVLGGSTADASLTKDELRDLFTLDQAALEEPSDTHKSLACECLDQYQIRTEAEANKAEEQSRQEAEEHIKRCSEAAEEEKRKAAELGVTIDQEEGKENGMSTSSPDVGVDGDTLMEDAAEPGAPAAGAEGAPNDAGEGEGEGEGEGDGEGEKSSSSDDDGDGEMNDFIVGDSDDDGGDDYGSKKKSAPKKASKKDGPRKTRKKRACIGSLNFPHLRGLTSCTLGQRGEPPEEELINWAHHATSNSIPDPIFRAAAKTMPFTRGQLPFVSFVFSCEVSGKAILNSSDATDAAAVSAICDAPPTLVQASKPVAVSLELAQAKHAEFMENERRKAAKRQGNDDISIEERLADPSKRRHSSRHAAKPNNHSDVPNDDDLDFLAPDDDDAGESPGDGDGGTTVASKKRKDRDIDPASLELINKLLQQDAGIEPKGRARKKTSKKPNNTIDAHMEDIAEESTNSIDEPANQSAAPNPPVSSTSSPSKKRKTDTGAVPVAGDQPISTDSPRKAQPQRQPPQQRPAVNKSPLKNASPSVRPRTAPVPVASLKEDTDSDIEVLDTKITTNRTTTTPHAAKHASPKKATPQPVVQPTRPPLASHLDVEESDDDFL